MNPERVNPERMDPEHTGPARLVGMSPERRDELITATMDYLKSLHCSQWGRSMSISQPDECREAAEYLVDNLLEPVNALWGQRIVERLRNEMNKSS